MSKIISSNGRSEIRLAILDQLFLLSVVAMRPGRSTIVIEGKIRDWLEAL